MSDQDHAADSEADNAIRGNVTNVRYIAGEDECNASAIDNISIPPPPYRPSDACSTVAGMSETDRNQRKDSDVNEKSKDVAEDLNPDSGSSPGEQPEGEQDTAGLPIDRGYAWVILFAAVFEIFIFGGVMKSFGVFFVQYQMRFGSSAAETSLISTVQNLVLSCVALFILTLVLKKIGERATVMIGTVFMFTGNIITAFATDIRVLYFSFGILGGLSMAMTYFPAVTAIGQYFRKHRGLANSIMSSGSSLGGLIFAPIVTTLFEEYGYTGASAIVAAIFFNIMISGALLRPMSFYTKRRKRLTKTSQTEEVARLDSELTENVTLNGQQTSVTTTTNSVPEDKVNGLPVTEDEDVRKPFLPGDYSQSHELARRHVRTLSGASGESTSRFSGVLDSISRSKVALYASSEVVCGSVLDVAKQQDSVCADEEVDGKCSPTYCLSKVLHLIKSATAKDSIIRNPVFLLYLGMAAFMLSGSALIPVYVAPYAKDIGIPTTKIGLLYSIAGGVDLFARIGAGFVADKKWVSHTTIVAVAAIIIGTASHLLRFVTSYPGLVVFALLMGLCCGVYLALFAAILADFMGLERFKSALGVTAFAHGTAIAIYFPLAGLLRDVSGSYLVTFHLQGVMLYIGAGFALSLPIIHRWREKRLAEVR